MANDKGYRRFVTGHDTGYQLQDAANCLRVGGHTPDSVNITPSMVPPVSGTCVFCGSTVSPQQIQKTRKDKSNA